MAVPARVGITPPYFFCRIVPEVPPNKPMTLALIAIIEIAFVPVMFIRGDTTTIKPTNPSTNQTMARAFKGSFRYLAAKRLTKTGCRLTIRAATPAGMPRLTAKKQPPK